MAKTIRVLLVGAIAQTKLSVIFPDFVSLLLVLNGAQQVYFGKYHLHIYPADLLIEFRVESGVPNKCTSSNESM